MDPGSRSYALRLVSRSADKMEHSWRSKGGRYLRQSGFTSKSLLRASLGLSMAERHIQPCVVACRLIEHRLFHEVVYLRHSLVTAFFPHDWIGKENWPAFGIMANR